MKKVLFIGFVLFGTFCISQNDKEYVNALVLEFEESLKNRNIDTFFHTKRYCIGDVKIFKLGDGSICISKETYYEVYFFWQEENSTMIKKIDNCGLYFSLPLNGPQVFNFVSEHLEYLKSDPVKKYAVQNPENVPTAFTQIYSCFRKFNFFTENDSFIQEYNLFSLTNESKQKNLHYEYNNTLKIVALDKLIDSLISEKGTMFKRQF